MQGSRHAAQPSGHAIRSVACHEICLQLLDDIRAASQLGNCFAEIRAEGVVPPQGSAQSARGAPPHQHKRSQPGDLLTTASQYFMDDADRSRPASAALPAAPAQPSSIEQREPAQP